jgi:hypothetical protein
MLHSFNRRRSQDIAQLYSAVLAAWFKKAHSRPGSISFSPSSGSTERRRRCGHTTAADGGTSAQRDLRFQFRSIGRPCTGEARSAADREGQSACRLHHPASSSSALRCSGSLEASADLTQRRASARASCRFMFGPFGPS